MRSDWLLSQLETDAIWDDSDPTPEDYRNCLKAQANKVLSKVVELLNRKRLENQWFYADTQEAEYFDKIAVYDELIKELEEVLKDG